MDNQQAQIVLVAERFQLCNDLIIVGIAEFVIGGFAYLLQSVHNDQLCIGMLADELFQLLTQAAVQGHGLCCKMQMLCVLCTKHFVQTLLNPGKVILQGEIKHLALMNRILPQVCSCGDVVTELRHEEGLTDLRRTHEEIGTSVQQVIDQHCLGRVSCIIQLRHGNRCEAAISPVALCGFFWYNI